MDVGWITAAPSASVPAGDSRQRAFGLESDRSITYAELLELQNRYANALLGLGVESGDRIGILLQNSVEYVALYFAVARIGGVAVRLNTRLTSDELQFALVDSGATVVCLHGEFAERIEPIRSTVPVRDYAIFGLPAGSSPLWASMQSFDSADPSDPPVPRPDGADPLMLMYTSGTTGFPKAAIWTHDNALGCAVSQAMQLEFNSETVAMTTGPLYHAGAFESLLLPALLRQGRAIATRSGAFDIERVVRVAAAEEVTDLLLYPYMLYDLMRLDSVTAQQLPKLRRIYTGGDPIMTWALDTARQRFPAVRLSQGYGLTESTQATCLNEVGGSRHPDSIGRPFPLNEVRIMDENDAEVHDGEVGELQIRGPATTHSYWNRPEETLQTFVSGGWLRTGDLARREDGLLFLAGRKKDMIRSGGENVSAVEVERVLTAHPAIRDAAVVAVPHAQFLEVGCAVIVTETDDELTDEQVVLHCRGSLAGYKCPKHIVRVHELPRNASGKVLKHELRETYRSIGEQPASV